MIDMKLLREDPERFARGAVEKGFEVDIAVLLQLDEALRKAKQRLQEIATEKNRIGSSIPGLSAGEREGALEQLAGLKREESACKSRIQAEQPKFEALLLEVPQPPDEQVPPGRDEAENIEVRKEGEVRRFDFEPKDHVQLGQDLGIIDIERGVRLAGTRNYFLKGDGALLSWAVLQFGVELMLARGYVPLSVPLLMKDQAMRGTGYYPGSEEQTYRLERDGLNLAGTAEVPLTAYRSGEIIPGDELPLRYFSVSSCFRREAGAAGRDTYGLYRIHQFDKVEQVVICRGDKDQSDRFHREILTNAEAFMQALELPYRVVEVCAGDLGRGQARKYDIEAWMPSRGAYCETHSASRFYDFQARRLGIRCKPASGGGTRFCHTLNNTVVATPRILIPILELYQNADGTVTIPLMLRPYMGGRTRLGGA